jgi:hypothetical protein
MVKFKIWDETQVLEFRNKIRSPQRITEIYTNLFILIADFRRDVDEICALLRYYAASCGNCLPTSQDNVSAPTSRVKILTHEVGADTSRNVGKQLPHDAA